MHPDRESLVRLCGAELSDPEAEKIRAHLETCEECAKAMRTMERFVTDLDESWTRKRLAEMAAQTHWPTREELVNYFLGDLPLGEMRREIEGHLPGCPACREVLQDMERGAGELERADPLGQAGAVPTTVLSWREALRALIRPTAWPAWSLAAATAALVFALGFILRPVLWPAGEFERPDQVAAVPKPSLLRQSDGTLALGIGPTVRPEARALFEKALASYDAPDFPDRALPALEDAVKVDPNFEQARFWLGVCHLLKGNATAAIPQLEEAARLAPGNMTYQHYLIWAYLRAGEDQKALEAQTQLLKKK